MEKITIWDSFCCAEDDGEVIELPDLGEQLHRVGWACQDYAKKHWFSNDYESETDLSVRLPSGEIVQFVVVAEPSINFIAHQKKVP